MENADTRLIIETIQPVVSGMGYDLVETKLGRSRHLDDITVVIYSAGGVSLQNCAEVSRNIRPRLELLEDFDNIVLKVTSPGIDRVLKNIDEYRIFKGRGVKVLLMDTNEWIGGIIKDCSRERLSLLSGAESLVINVNNIRKAKLDYSEEVKHK